MAISNLTFEHILTEIKPLCDGARIDKVFRINDQDFGLLIFNKHSYNLIISLNPKMPIITLTDEKMSFVLESTPFISFLKKYLEGSKLQEIKKIENDRVFEFHIRSISPTFQVISIILIIELIPLRSNAILCDDNYVIMDAYRKSNSLDEKRPIYKGIHYTYETMDSKEIFPSDNEETLKYKVNKSELEFIRQNGLEAFLKEVNAPTNYYLYKYDLSLAPLKDSKVIPFNNLYSVIKENEVSSYFKNKYENIISIVDNRVHSLNKKVKNLQKDLSSYEPMLDYAKIGNRLFSLKDTYRPGQKEISDEDFIIKLDPALDLSSNAKKYFKLYQKAKNGIVEVKNQISLANDEKNYLLNIQNQLAFASEEDMKDILDDLASHQYIKVKTKKFPKKKKDIKPSYKPHFVYSPSKIKIGYGCSSFQNDYLTFTLASKNDLFLHIKDSHGPHVIIFDNDPDEETILLACEIALYYAKKSGGDVVFTEKYNVKKVAGHLGLVTFTKYQTITLKSIRESTIQMLKKH